MTPAQATEYLKRIPPDEPVFVLRAQDKAAVETVRTWIYKVAEHLGWNHPKITSAEAVVSAMVDFPFKKHAD